MDKITDFFKNGADTIVSGLKTGTDTVFSGLKTGTGTVVSGLKTGTDKLMDGVKVGTDKVKEIIPGQGKEENKEVGEKSNQSGAAKPSAPVDAASKYQCD